METNILNIGYFNRKYNLLSRDQKRFHFKKISFPMNKKSEKLYKNNM